MKILVMGLPGSGKTYLTERLVPLLEAAWYNADKVRDMANDWDFSNEGRSRQSNRMKVFADFEKSHGRFVVCEFGWIQLMQDALRIQIKYLKSLKM
jgi:adenylylsulfate kinase